MAALRALKLLMLWAGMTALASSTTPVTQTTNRFSPTASNRWSSQRSQTQSLSSAMQSTTADKSNSQATQANLMPSECSFNVSLIKFGLRIEMINATAAEYVVSHAEKNQRERKENVTFSDKNPEHDILHLKPCTKYELSVAFVNKKSGVQITCNSTTDHWTTLPMEFGDIQPGNLTPGSVCYRSGWRPMVVKRKGSRKIGNETCFELDTEEICSTITLTFLNVGTCGNFSKISENITIDFLDESKLVTEVPKSIPGNMNLISNLPSKCANLSVEYTCTENENKNVTRNLTDLEPYTSYSCSGLIMDNNNATNKKISIRPFDIDCDFQIMFEEKKTYNSIELSLWTTNTSCKGFSYNRTVFSTECVCSSKNGNNEARSLHGDVCMFPGLSAYTDYVCVLMLRYKNKIKIKEKTIPTIRTLEGEPDPIIVLNSKVPEHNVIEAFCDPISNFNGPNQVYIAYLDNRTKQTNSECRFQFKDLSYSTKYTIEVFAFNGKHRGRSKFRKESTLYNDKAVTGFLVFLILLTSVALVLVLYKIYVLKRRRSHEVGEGLRLISTANDEDHLMSVEPIAAEILLETYKRKLADESRLFFAEFQSIPRIFSRYTVKEAKRTCNAPKNRYVDILPYDYNRVHLTTGNGQAGSDYINASFIDGFTEPKKYIAAQGPKTETVCDFWRMIWEQQSSIIVMVTRCEEGNKVKCAQYWPSPDQQTEIFEEFVVKLNSEDLCPDYIIRHLSLINKREKNSEREVTHIQFMSWPDHGIPEEPQLLLKLRRRVNAFKNLFSGPIVVHCSAGVGRTGTYISIDGMMECLDTEGRVDVYGSVVKLRRQRGHMVQVEPQYILIHQTLLEHNQFGETEIALSELHGSLSALTHKNPDDEPTLLQEEFEKLPSFKNWATLKAGTTEENERKNRSMSVIPYDYNRVLLRLDDGQSPDTEHNEEEDEETSDEEDEDSVKYINASHINGYWSPRAFIAAQTPLPDTVADFWLMVHQKKVAAIVMLSDGSAGDKDADSGYWDHGKTTFGEIEVQLARTDTFPTFISRSFLVRHVKMKDSRPVTQFQFLKWGASELPEKPQELTEMLKSVKVKCCSDKRERNTPVVVHCNDGSSRSGIVCALWNLLDSAETEKLVDVFQEAKTMRKQRQGMFPSLEHYHFLYRALENLFPVTNGEAKPAQVAAADSVQVVDETKAEEKPVSDGQLQSATTDDQQEAEDSSPLVIKEEEKGEEPEQEPVV